MHEADAPSHRGLITASVILDTVLQTVDLTIANVAFASHRRQSLGLDYLHPEGEAGTFDEEGFFRTGDFEGWVEGPYLVGCGHAKDIAIRNDESVSPKKIEDILAPHPEIAEVAIVALSDPRTGERARAVIAPQRPPGLDVARLRAFPDPQGVARFKVSEQVVTWRSLLKNDAGKVLQHKIKAALQ